MIYIRASASHWLRRTYANTLFNFQLSYQFHKCPFCFFFQIFWKSPSLIMLGVSFAIVFWILRYIFLYFFWYLKKKDLFLPDGWSWWLEFCVISDSKPSAGYGFPQRAMAMQVPTTGFSTFTYSKGRAQRQRHRFSIRWFSHQMAAIAKTGRHSS